MVTKLPETRAGMKKRLQDEGRWDEFKKVREAKAQELGCKLIEATEHVYDQFSPLPEKPETPVAAEPVTDMEVAADQPLDSGGDPAAGDDLPPEADELRVDPFRRINLRAAVQWVFDNLGSTTIGLKDAPSTGAWSLFQWAGKSAVNQTEFYRTFVSKLLPSRSDMEREDQMEDDGQDVLDTIDKLVAAGNALQPPGPEGPDG